MISICHPLNQRISMKKIELFKRFLITGFLLIIIAFLLWIEFSFIMGGIGVMIIGIGIMIYINKE